MVGEYGPWYSFQEAESTKIKSGPLDHGTKILQKY